MDTVKCPVCGEVNPADAEFCRNCLSRLEPLAGPAKGEDAPLQPGQVPTKKTTADLEPILPQWLREARETARQSASEEAADSSSNINNTRRVASSKPDLLAGLASQGKDEDNEAEEVPDWLVSLTGDVPVQKKKADEPDAGDGQRARWVELGGEEEKPSSNNANPQASSGTSVENTTPSWMAPQEPAPEKDELADWLSRAGMLPTRYVLQYCKVLLMSRHSSPEHRLATFVNGITPPLRSILITRTSSLLRAAPPLVPASVFFLMVSAICYFPSHPEQGSHVPYQSLC